MLSVRNRLISMIGFAAAVFAAVFGVFMWGKNRGREAEENKQLLTDLRLAANEIEKTEEVRKVLSARESALQADIRANAEAKQETKEQAKSRDSFDFNKWAVLIAAFLSVSCVAKETVVYKSVLPYLPYQQIFERPIYSGGIISFGDNESICFDRGEFGEIFDFVTDLKEVIKNYEAQAKRTNEYNSSLEEIYKINQ